MGKCCGVVAGCAAAAALVAGCGPRHRAEEDLLAVIGSDTLRLAHVRELTGRSEYDSVAVQRALRQFVLASQIDDSVAVGQAGDEADLLATRLSLRADAGLSPTGARSLLTAARFLAQTLDASPEGDSAATVLERVLGAFPQAALPAKALERIAEEGEQDSLHHVARLQELLAVLFDLDDVQAGIVAGFALARKSVETDSVKVRDLVRHLVRDDTPAPPAPKGTAEHRPARPREQQPDRSEQILAYRTQQSITDSIATHEANIKALYKRQLRKREGLQGVVTVRFRVDPSGRVIEAAIASSMIDDAELTQQLLAYVQTIRFRESPGQLGNMTFQFPFAFSPEG